MKLIAYHSNLYFDSFKEHVAEIKAKGFDTILFCITETDVLYNLQTLKEFRIHAENSGLKTWATFWGLYAGEAIVKDLRLEQWVNEVYNAGFRDIMIDEPKDVDIMELCFELLFYPGNFHLCLTDDTFNSLSDEDIIDMPVRSLGVSCYHWIEDWQKIYERTTAISKRLVSLRPKDNFIFVQGFDIPVGMEMLPVRVKSCAYMQGINNFAFWSFRCTVATSSKRPVNHKRIWEGIKF